MNQEEAQQIEQLKEQVLVKTLAKDARERLSRVRSVDPQRAAQVELYLLGAFQSGKIGSQMSDQELKDILTALTDKKEFNVKRG